MHELSIAYSLLNLAIEECIKRGFSKIQKIKITISSASNIMPEALLFSFNALKQETIAQESILYIEKIPLSGICQSCNTKITTFKPFIIECPVCHDNSLNLQIPDDLKIDEIEVT
ncbi:MAG: hydrogenase maturation nickel metallochaperone HypA [Thermodesulfovibrionales bacterium]|nr:hydrogenase maturation nickel metallochaperone HypA [Thermodesulfovibrionales bacterium]